MGLFNRKKTYYRGGFTSLVHSDTIDVEDDRGNKLGQIPKHAKFDNNDTNMWSYIVYYDMLDLQSIMDKIDEPTYPVFDGRTIRLTAYVKNLNMVEYTLTTEMRISEYDGCIDTGRKCIVNPVISISNQESISAIQFDIDLNQIGNQLYTEYIPEKMKPYLDVVDIMWEDIIENGKEITQIVLELESVKQYQRKVQFVTESGSLPNIEVTAPVIITTPENQIPNVTAGYATNKVYRGFESEHMDELAVSTVSIDEPQDITEPITVTFTFDETKYDKSVIYEYNRIYEELHKIGYKITKAELHQMIKANHSPLLMIETYTEQSTAPAQITAPNMEEEND